MSESMDLWNPRIPVHSAHRIHGLMESMDSIEYAAIESVDADAMPAIAAMVLTSYYEMKPQYQ